jgi:hypothetical protein
VINFTVSKNKLYQRGRLGSTTGNTAPVPRSVDNDDDDDEKEEEEFRLPEGDDDDQSASGPQILRNIRKVWVT